MKQFIPFVILLFLALSLKAQSSFEVTSSDGYTVTINLVPTGIQVNQPCPFGYNYDVVFDYDISFSGTNIPANLWTLQGNVGCGASTLFLPLNNSGGVGQTITNGNAYEGDCSVAPSVAALNCDEFVLTIQGPGIPFQQINASFVLPVDFLSFAARPNGKSVQLDWATASETDNDFFEIQRSRDAINWQSLEQISGKGTTSDISTYTFYDADPEGTILYYRLKQVDYDGSFAFSDVVAVALGEAPLAAFPNPTNNIVTLTASGTVSLHDLTGRVLQTQNNGAQKGQLTFDLSDLPEGLYLLRAEDSTQKILKH
ncbi:MAG: T9SS type A sorting domain-containing protein [Bacteroidota bacterium]